MLGLERDLLGGGLYFDDSAIAGQHEICVGLGIAVFGIVKIGNARTAIQPAGNRGDAGTCRDR